MTEVLTQITAGELVRRLLQGERDFSRTRLAAGDADLSAAEGYAEMNAYLQGLQDLRENPITAAGADWRGIRAPGLYFLGARMSGVDLRGADLRDADIRRADLSGANLQGADVSGAVFIGTRLMESDFSGATMLGVDLYEANLSRGILRDADITNGYLLRLNLSEVDLTNAKLTNVELYRSDLRRAIGLETVRDLGTCHFKHTIVTQRERDIIEQAFRALPRFDMRAE